MGLLSTDHRLRPGDSCPRCGTTRLAGKLVSHCASQQCRILTCDQCKAYGRDPETFRAWEGK